MVDIDNLTLTRLIIKKHPSEIKDFLSRESFDVKGFRKFTNRNKISGYIYSALKEPRAIELFPAKLVDLLQSHYINQGRKSMEILLEMEGLLELLTRDGIEAIFLKGPFFAKRYYEEIGQRSIADIDLLVRKEDSLNHADNMLKIEGYQPRSMSILGQYMTTIFTHHYEYRKKGIKLDLHWAFQSHFSYKINYGEIWGQKKSFLHNGKAYNVLSDEYELVFQILSIFMDIQLGTIRLKSFVDVFKIIRRIDSEIDWNGFFTRREKEGLFFISLNILDLVIQILNCQEDFSKLSQVVERNKNNVIYKDAGQKIKLLNSSYLALRNKIWAFQLYNAPFLKCLIWWLISLPFKIAVYREVCLKPVKRSLKRLNPRQKLKL
ncbi:MAG: nucleotidyltransferase family protein [Candidatus Dadabacteria bacterium]|nr:nucleotidyltransferase family protein [Candidatus Dadabacteria bacterium]